jgi:hypothetical protein
MNKRLLGITASLAVLLTLAGCASTGRGKGPLDAFTFPAGANASLTRDVPGAIEEGLEPKEIRLVVPAGTDLRSLVATLSLSKAASIEVVSSGTPVAQQNGVTPNDFSVPVTYSIAVPGEKQAWTYKVFVREAENNARLSTLVTPRGTLLQPAFNPAVHAYSLDVPFAAVSVRIEARGQTGTLKSVTVDGAESPGPVGAAAVSFSSGQERAFSITTLAEDGVTSEKYTVTLRRGAPDANAALAALEVTGAPLMPAFSPQQRSYQAVAPFGTTRLSVRARPQSPVAAIDMGSDDAALGFSGKVTDANGAQVDFSSGNRMSLILTVTAEDQSLQQYVVDVLRAPPDNNNLLTDLSAASDGTTLVFNPPFTPGRFLFAAEIPYSARHVTVFAMPQSKVAAARVEVMQAPGVSSAAGVFTGAPQAKAGATVDFPATQPRILLLVTVAAQDGSEQRYTIDVRRARPDRNADLASLAPSTGTLAPAFSARIVSYSLALPAAADSVTITAAAASALADVGVAEQPGVKPAAGVSATIRVAPGSESVASFVVSAEDGSQKLYRVRVTREAASVPPPPADAGADLILVNAKNLKLSPRESGALLAAGDRIGNQAGITVRYYRSAEVISRFSVPVDVTQQGQTSVLNLAARSNGVTLDRNRLVEVEVAIPTARGHFLFYTEAQASDDQVVIDPPFLFYGDDPHVRWPAVGSPVAVGGYLSQLPVTKNRDVDKESFDKNAKGEYRIAVKIADAKTGASYGTDGVFTKPGQGRARSLNFGKPLQVPEGATVTYVLTAKAKNGKSWSATGTTQVWTTQMRYPEGFQPVLLFVTDDLRPGRGDG